MADFTLTGSLIYRFDDTPLENQGVTPNFPYRITVEDLAEEYKPLIQAVNSALESML